MGLGLSDPRWVAVVFRPSRGILLPWTVDEPAFAD